MGITCRCWIIANFEIIMYVLLLVVSAILLFGISDLDNAFKIFSISALVAGMLSFPTNKSIFQFGKYLFLVGMGIVMTIGANNPENANDVMKSLIVNRFWTVFIIASVISVIIAVYTYINIDEVLSRRMLYLNSNVSIFEYSWLYTLDRFCNISLSIVVCTFWLWLIISVI
ncbi:MAG: hypothetical protein FWF72_01455 [Paludibacter sp.]|nr:hypothetical protein [Paludibacter sp.]